MSDEPRPDDRRADDRRSDRPRTPEAAAHSDATDVTAYLLAGPAAFGLIGKGLDLWLSTAFLLPVGLVAGFALSIYIVWVRYGRA